MSITLIQSDFPRDLLRHFTRERGFQVETPWPGIYRITGDALPIQVNETRKLSADNTQWLLDFNDKLSAERLRAREARVEPMIDNPAIRAYLAPIYAANIKLLKEMTGMRMTAAMRQVLITEGWGRELMGDYIAEGEAIGEARAEARTEARVKAAEARVKAAAAAQIRQLREENRRLQAEVKKAAGKKLAGTQKSPVRKTAAARGKSASK
jgi:hypothetical protein